MNEGGGGKKKNSNQIQENYDSKGNSKILLQMFVYF